MPDDYYVSQYSGEEIDALLGSAGAGTVRYDAAQTLTDAQKEQARANIDAAPDGFGLGTSAQTISTDWNEALSNGWWKDGNDNLLNRPFPGLWGIGLTTNYAENSHSVQSAFWIDSDGSVYQKIRGRYQNGTWGTWEWVNPPMQPGVEYRTTERFFGKPVYVKVVNCGQLSDGKEVEHGISNMDYCISAQGLMSGLALPQIINHDLSNTWSAYISQVTKTKIRFECGTTVVGNNIAAVLKYTKTTD